MHLTHFITHTALVQDSIDSTVDFQVLALDPVPTVRLLITHAHTFGFKFMSLH